jgi:hypothetical protein
MELPRREMFKSDAGVGPPRAARYSRPSLSCEVCLVYLVPPIRQTRGTADQTDLIETIVDRLLSGGSPMGGRVGSREGGGSSTGGSSWDGGSLTGGRLRRGSLIGVFFRLFILSNSSLKNRDLSQYFSAKSLAYPLGW